MEKELVEKAVGSFRAPPEMYNCAQSVVSVAEDASLLDEMKSCGGGRAPEGLCGALWGAMALSPAEERESVKAAFRERLGGVTCAELKGTLQVPCAECVRVAAELAKFGKPSLASGAGKVLKSLVLGLSVFLSSVLQAGVEKDHLKLYASFDNSVRPEIALDGFRLESEGDSKQAEGRFAGARSFLQEGEGRRLEYRTGEGFGADGWSIAMWINMNEDANHRYGDRSYVRGVFSAGDLKSTGKASLFFTCWIEFLLDAWPTAKGKATRTMVSSRAIPKRKWTHLTAVFRKDGTHDLYLNGNVAVYSERSDRTKCTAVDRILVGTYYGKHMLDGCVDELKIFDKALTPDEVKEIMTSLPLRKTADIAAYIPCDGNPEGRGVSSSSGVDLIFGEAYSYEGVKIVRHGYDRRAIMTVGGLETGNDAMSLFMYFKPDWKKDEPQDVRHGLVATGGEDFRYALEKNGEGLVFSVNSQGKEAKAVLKDADWTKDGFRKISAGYDYAKKMMFVSVDGKKSEAVFDLPRPKGKEKSSLFVGDVRGADTYSKTQAEGTIDEILIARECLSPADLEEVVATEIAKKAKKSVVTIDTKTPTEKEAGLWSLDGAERKKTATRETVTLNALWRFQLTDSKRKFNPDDWIYLAVPGRYAGWENGAAFTEFYMRDKNFKTIRELKYDGRATYGFLDGWYERGFLADEKWKGKIVSLKIDELSPSQSGTVFLNGKVLANLIGGGVYFNIRIPEHLLKFGDWNFITVNTVDSGARWNWRGVKGDVSLEIVSPVSAAEPEIVTSVKKGELTVSAKVKNSSSRDAEVYLEAEISGENSPGVVSLGKCSVPAGGEISKSKTISWKDAKLWDIDSPNLYGCTIRLRDAGGKIVDEMERFRFGFREFEIHGRDFFLNGKKIHLFINDQWMNQITHDETRKTARLQKKTGFNTVRMDFATKEYDSELLMDACDEEGLLFLPNVRGVTGGSYALWSNPETRKRLEMQMRELILRYRNHASAVMWYLSINFLGYSWDYHPLKIADGYVSPVKYDKYKTCLEGVDILRKYDGSKRPYFFQAGGTYGEVQTSNAYFCWWPQIERRAWPEEWEKTGNKPMIPIETSFPYFRSFYGMDLFLPGEKPLFYFENLARYYGPEAYSTNDVEMLGEVAKSAVGKEGQVFYDAPAFQNLKSWLLSDTLKFWRGYDLSGFCPFAEIDYAYGRHAKRHMRFSAKRWPMPERDFRRFGYTHDFEKVPYQKDVNTDLPLPSKDGLEAGMAPELAFFDGGAENAVDASANCYAGSRLSKRLALINDRRRAVAFSGEWTFGNVSRKFDALLEPGEKKYVDIDIDLPRVDKPRKFVLSAKAKGTAELEIDPLEITVYPRHSAKGIGSFALYDPVGMTASKLESLGVGFKRTGNPAEVESGLLVIGACSLTKEVFESVRKNVESGALRVVSMAQKPETLKAIGVGTTAIYAREAFDANGKMAGFWAGKGMMAPDKPAPDPATEKNMPSPFFHWNNSNIVCAYPVLRPKNGACKAIYSCGKDLVYSPLAEFECMKGKFVFCQFEIENRTKADPEADGILLSLLASNTRVETKRKLFDRIAGAEEAAKYGIKTNDAKMRTFEANVAFKGLFASLSKRDKFFRRSLDVKTFEGEGVTPLFEPAFAAVKEIDGEKVVFLGIPEKILEKEFKFAEKAGVKSSALWAAETQESRLNLVRSILESACGVEHAFPEPGWKSTYHTETHIRW